jgi:hypothetical protein
MPEVWACLLHRRNPTSSSRYAGRWMEIGCPVSPRRGGNEMTGPARTVGRAPIASRFRAVRSDSISAGPLYPLNNVPRSHTRTLAGGAVSLSRLAAARRGTRVLRELIGRGISGGQPPKPTLIGHPYCIFPIKMGFSIPSSHFPGSGSVRGLYAKALPFSCWAKS